MNKIILNVTIKENGEYTGNEIHVFNEKKGIKRFILSFLGEKERVTKANARQTSANGFKVGFYDITFAIA